MKKFAALLFVMFSLVSNVTLANEECHPEKEHCEDHH